MSVAQNLARIRESLGSYPVTLIAVSKTAGLNEIKEAFENGVTEFGENRIQDALKKQDALPPHMAERIHWHFIGHLQSNKVRKALGRFVLIHSVDSPELALALAAEAAKQGVEQRILLQVKVVADPGKSGFSPDSLAECFAKIYKLPGLRVDGLMTMTPLTCDDGVRNECFHGLKRLKEDIEKRHGIGLKELSMGMSDDYIDAVKCGATMVRIGRAIFQKTENY
jgi:PLP dependent protein